MTVHHEAYLHLDTTFLYFCDKFWHTSVVIILSLLFRYFHGITKF